ncbi:DNA-directed RNA polymerase III subunit RPC7 [Calliphora vicina]|uniref:DNA-directed RNA polymerase III subunit RPC7 n=1 Tax=Calliphora vicina TaxID=7373 RepID=UPI00325A9F0A
MAGRGRGKTGSLTQEQLQTLGCVGKDMPQVQTAPPPTYPPLMSKPVTLETTAAQSYQILWKEDFLNHMRDSPYFLQTLEKTKINKSILSYGQKTANDTESNKMKTKAEFNWSLMPAELQMANRKRKTDLKPKDVKKTKTGNIEDRLKQLEEKERTDNDKETGNKNNSDSEQEMEENEEVVDDEMDDENDYGNSYFDNGEAYNEEDDNLDDGPVY